MIQYTKANIRTWSIMGSSGTVGLVMLDIAEKNDKIFVMTADQSINSGLARFKETFPTRYINAGIAEQNMVTIAAGLAKEGFNPYITAQAPFITMRCTDQVRVNLGYMQLPVKLIGIASGYAQGEFGATHESINDLSVIRSIPNITILSPADCTETAKVLESISNYNNPVYVRLTGMVRNPIVYKEDYNFEIGKAITLKEGSDIAIIATGTMVYEALNAAKILEEKGISVKVVDMHTIKPIDTNIIKECNDTKLIVTVEEHSVIGGLGSAVSEVLIQLQNHTTFLPIGIDDSFVNADEYETLLCNAGLKSEQIADKILKKYKGE